MEKIEIKKEKVKVTISYFNGKERVRETREIYRPIGYKSAQAEVLADPEENNSNKLRQKRKETVTISFFDGKERRRETREVYRYY